jgi:malonyl-CoA O-methyltransferase
MRAVQAFSRAADTYGQYNRIQREVARHLVSNYLPSNLGTILDLGCGSGVLSAELQRAGVDYDTLIGVDLSESMLSRHSCDEKTELLQGNFNDPAFLHTLGERGVRTVLSSSSLQWATDLDLTFQSLSTLGERAAFAIFTAGTFRTLHRYLGVTSPIRDFGTVQGLLERYYDVDRIERRLYRLDFQSQEELFRYIKGSGVTGGSPTLSVAVVRRLLREYPYRSLEFEVLFFAGSVRSSFSRA